MVKVIHTMTFCHMLQVEKMLVCFKRIWAKVNIAEVGGSDIFYTDGDLLTQTNVWTQKESVRSVMC